MNKRFTWGKLISIGAVLCVFNAQADIKMSGHTETGWGFNKPSGATGSAQFLVDEAVLELTAEVTEKTKVVIKKAISFNTLA